MEVGQLQGAAMIATVITRRVTSLCARGPPPQPSPDTMLGQRSDPASPAMRPSSNQQMRKLGNDPHYPLPRALQEPNWPPYLRNYFGLRQLADLGGG